MLLFLIFNLLTQFANATSHAQNHYVPYSFKEDRFSLGFEATYLSTNANYNAAGESQNLLSGNKFKMYEGLLYSRYDYSHKFSFYADFPMNYATEDDPIQKRTKFQTAGVNVGVNYDLGFYFFKMILDVRGYYSMEKWDQNADEMLTSDGAHKVELGSHVFKKFENFLVHGYLGYEYRSSGFSSLLNYQADLSYFISRYAFSIGLEGYKSIADDTYKDTPSVRHTHLSNVNAGSYAVASVDPSQLNAFTTAKVFINKSLDVYGGFSKSLSGENAADQMAFSVGLEYFWENLFKKNKYEYDEEDTEDETSAPEQFSPINQNEEKRYEKKSNPLPHPRKEPVIDKKNQEKILKSNPEFYKTTPQHKQQAVPRNLPRKLPKKKVRLKELEDRPKNYKTSDPKNELTISKKNFGKPKKIKHHKRKSKKLKRVRIDF